MTAKFQVIGVGASAGGLEALERLLSGIDASAPWAWVVVQHLAPDHKSLMAEILTKRTALPVQEARDGDVLEGGRVYLAPSHANVAIDRDVVRLVDRSIGHALNLPVDVLFRSLAETRGEEAVGVVLSGTGSDGRAGVEAIKQAGGLVIVQDPAGARFDGMPQAAIGTGLVDAVVPAERIPGEIQRQVESAPLELPSTDELQRLYRLLEKSSTINFAEYKPATVMRRVAHRQQTLGVGSFAEYLERAELHEDEARKLADDLLINVTRFFRDAPAWDTLERLVIPQLARGSGLLRVWVPACASGQEAYSIAMLLTEGLPGRDFKVFASDVDGAALQTAAAGHYSQAELEGVSPARLERFFVADERGASVSRELRSRIVFAPHNIARDAPFTRLDLVSCRNLLIYLSLPLQRRVLDTFAFALRPDGFLMLGPSESLGAASDRFRTVDGQWKLYQRLPGRSLPVPGLSTLRESVSQAPVRSQEQMATEAAFRVLMEKVAPTSVLVTEHQQLVSVFGNASGLLTVPLGLTSFDLGAMLPSELHTTTTLAIHRALSANTEVTLIPPEVRLGVAAVRAVPLTLPLGHRYVVVSFERSAQSSAAVAISASDSGYVGELQRELSSVRDSLQATIEQLETSNEELQATNEELLAANEELQSTNEELQSVNEELSSVNVEHQARIGELTRAHEDLDNLFQSSAAATLFLDEYLKVRRFTASLAPLMSLLERDIGRPIEHFAASFDDAGFMKELKRVLDTGGHREAEVMTRETQRRFLMRMTPYLTAQKQIRGVVVTFVDITDVQRAEDSRKRLQLLIDSLPEHVAVVDPQGVIQFVNSAWATFARSNGADALDARVGVGASYLGASAGAPAVRDALLEVIAGRRESFSYEYPCHSPAARRWFLMHVGRLADGSGAVVSHIDITARKLAEGARE
ncbi:MAG: chemotaxis protein CheB [Myxococcaceae bacterium]|nr:chemotaxis protein CheB [Myxococcaceae bacterium]